MKLYYSGAQSFWNSQVKSNLSLGGWISNSPIPNSLPGNIFGSISQLTIERKLPEYRLVVLKNERGVAVTDIAMYFEYPEDYPFVKYEVALVQPTVNSNGESYFEKIDNIYTAPLYITGWSEADGIDNALDLGSLSNNAFLGIWIKRTILDAVAGYFTEDAILANYQLETPVELPITDTTQLKLTWEEA